MKVFAIPAVFMLAACASARDDAARPEEAVLFLCPYGGAKSVIAATYFERAAREAGLPHDGVAAAAVEPYDAVPAPVAEYLLRDGIDVRAFKPRRVEASDLASAERVVRIDCELPADLEKVPSENWADVPKVSEDLEGSVAAIRRHVDELVRQLKSAK